MFRHDCAVRNEVSRCEIEIRLGYLRMRRVVTMQETHKMLCVTKNMLLFCLFYAIEFQAPSLHISTLALLLG